MSPLDVAKGSSMPDCFRSILLIGRPAAGKSEIIDYLKSAPLEERMRRFHVGEMVEIDDFPYLWEKFEEDDLLEKHGRARLHTTSDYHFLDPWFWNFLILKIGLAYEKHRQRDPQVVSRSTALVEFSRGGDSGFREAFSYLSESIRRDSGLVYIKVSYEESARTLLNNYLDNVEAFCNKSKIRDPITEELVEPDEKLMRSIEEQIGVTETAKKAFREEILIRISSLARRGQKFDYTSHERLKEAIEKKLFSDLKDIVKITTSTKTPDAEQLRKVNDVVERLVAREGYCAICANEMLKYVGTLLSR